MCSFGFGAKIHWLSIAHFPFHSPFYLLSGFLKVRVWRISKTSRKLRYRSDRFLFYLPYRPVHTFFLSAFGALAFQLLLRCDDDRRINLDTSLIVYEISSSSSAKAVVNLYIYIYIYTLIDTYRTEQYRTVASFTTLSYYCIHKAQVFFCARCSVLSFIFWQKIHSQKKATRREISKCCVLPFQNEINSLHPMFIQVEVANHLGCTCISHHFDTWISNE